MVFVPKIFLLIIFAMLCSCSGSQNRPENRNRSNEYQLENYIKYNKQLVAEEQNIIKRYIDTEGLEMQQTQTGLWYNIRRGGSGTKVQKGKVVSLKYKISLLDGTICYSSDNKGPKVFLVGQGGVESGLEEGVLLLEKGDGALFIMPPHLAHGLIGDDDKIPPRAILVYDVEVIEINNKNN